MLSFIKNLFATKVELAEFNPGYAFRIEGVSVNWLADCVGHLPSVAFTKDDASFGHQRTRAQSLSSKAILLKSRPTDGMELFGLLLKKVPSRN